MPRSPLAARAIVQMPSQRDGDGWTISESIGGTCVSFSSRQDAREYADFARLYVDRWGYINFASAPYALVAAPVAFTAEHVPEDMLPGVLEQVHAQLYVPLLQAESWDRNRHLRSAYSTGHCCHCGITQQPATHHVMVTRNDSGDWWIVRPTAPPMPDEGMELANRGTVRERGPLPIGATCLRKHHHYRIGLISQEPTHG